MTNVVYWTEPEEPEMWEGLMYLLAHHSEEAAKKSFAAFRSDPEWLAVKQASEEMSGGSLTKALLAAEISWPRRIGHAFSHHRVEWL